MSYTPPDAEARVAVETAAREKAWRDFLAEVRMSLEVWRIDDALRIGCEPVTAWLRRCRDDLDRWVTR